MNMNVIQAGSQVARHVRQIATTAARRGGKFLAFRLGDEEYGIDLLKVQEIRSYEAPTRIANAPAFVRGVLDLRGVIMPVVDLRLTFGCRHAEIDALTVVIVLNVDDRLIGAVVDSVNDVLELQSSEIRAAPPMALNLDTDFIDGIASVEARMLILLDIEALMSSPSLGLARVQEPVAFEALA